MTIDLKIVTQDELLKTYFKDVFGSLRLIPQHLEQGTVCHALVQKVFVTRGH